MTIASSHGHGEWFDFSGDLTVELVQVEQGDLQEQVMECNLQVHLLYDQ